MTKIVYLAIRYQGGQLFAVYLANTIHELEEKIREVKQDKRFWLEVGFIGVYDEFPISEKISPDFHRLSEN